MDVFMRQGLKFLVSILLARLLSPEEFGLVAMLYLFTGIADIFIDSGLSAALIQRQDITHADESTVFFFNLGVGLLVALELCLAAPWIAAFFEQPVLRSLTYAMALNLFVSAFGNIQYTVLNKALDFKLLMKIGFVASLLSGILAVVLAWQGFGVWSLAIQILASTLITVVLLWLWHPWRPQWIFDLAALRSLFRFGGFMFFSGLLHTLYIRSYSVFIGKLFSAQELGYYTRADNIQLLPASVLTTVLNRVAFPVFSAAAADKARLARGMRKVLRMIMLFNIPIMLGLVVVAEPLVITLIGEKWLPSVPILQVLCLAGLTLPLQVINLSALMAQGRSNLFFRVEILKKFIGVIAIVWASFYGVLAIAWSQVAVNLLYFLIDAYYTGVFLGYPAWKQARDLLPYLVISGFMALVVWSIHCYSILSPSAQLGLMIGVGATVYVLTCCLFRLEVFVELWDLLISRLRPAKNLCTENP